MTNKPGKGGTADTADGRLNLLPGSPNSITMEEWHTEGVRRFGTDEMRWRFICPSCGHVASTQDYKDSGAPQNAVAFSCVGRWLPARSAAFSNKPGPCDYAGGGLIGLNPIRIEGRTRGIFAFAEDADVT